MDNISAIVPAFNEAKGISRVLSVLELVQWLDEIIVVDDGSRDATSDIANRFRIKDNRFQIIQHSKNLGKGRAIYTGLKTSTGKIIVTLDADLFGLTATHLVDLISPVINNQVDMTSAVFVRGKWYSDLSHQITPWLSGQRCLRKEKYLSISWAAANGYGLETAITLAAKEQLWKTKKIFWHGVYHTPSEGHRGLLSGIFNRAKMYIHIIRAYNIATLEKSKKKYS